MKRHDDRRADELRPLKFKRRYTRASPGSVLVQAGRTTVLCTASVELQVPPWLKGKGQGWVTAEYSMLPGSTSPRKSRDRGGKIDGRTTEIQRLIGRSLRAVVDMQALGECSITIDCDVLEADGGTRTASITGAFVALVDAVAAVPRPTRDAPPILRDSVAAISVGIVDGRAVLDLDYAEDSTAAVDMNVVMTGAGRFVEVQGTGEHDTFDDAQLAALLKVARHGIKQLTELQRAALGKSWPF
ncbi:MAG: ribonuclease PH [Planctomycetes bacterium]|nr:ribonuclease PH [Planctomycetota bacterium]